LRLSEINTEMSFIWPQLGEDAAIKRWAHELCTLRQTPSPADWDHVGHGVIVEIEDIDEAESLVKAAAATARFDFVGVKARDVMDCVESLLTLARTPEPTIVFLGPGRWQDGEENAKSSRPAESHQPASELEDFRESLTDLFAEALCSLPIVVVTAVRRLGELHVDLRSAGAFDRKIHVAEPTIDMRAACFSAEVGPELLGDSITSNPRRLGCLLQYEYRDRRRRQLCQIALSRIAWRERRKIEFADLVNFAAHGTGEFDLVPIDEEIVRRTAIHEAGHALVSHLDSRQKIPPEYCSVVKRQSELGLVVPAFEAHEASSTDLSFCDVLHKIRVSLAGRVAEDLVLGVQQSSAAGAAMDLQSATELATSLITEWGYGPDHPAENLGVFGGASRKMRFERIESDVNQLLKQEYEKAKRVIESNRRYYDSIVRELREKKVMFSDDFNALATYQ
jgi:cell division protease FtsH